MTVGPPGRVLGLKVDEPILRTSSIKRQEEKEEAKRIRENCASSKSWSRREIRAVREKITAEPRYWLH
jgi:hypothetical protein